MIIFPYKIDEKWLFDYPIKGLSRQPLGNDGAVDQFLDQLTCQMNAYPEYGFTLELSASPTGNARQCDEAIRQQLIPELQGFQPLYVTATGRPNRTKFITAHGATCRNWTWSWSFVNHEQRFVLFGAWKHNQVENKNGQIRQRLLDQQGEDKQPRRNPGFKQGKEHLELVRDHGYRLFTFPMEYGEEEGHGAIMGFSPKLTEKVVGIEPNDTNPVFWYADPLP